jgi:exosortase F-associated protein
MDVAQKQMRFKVRPIHLVWLAVALLVLSLVYLFQRFNYLHFFTYYLLPGDRVFDANTYFIFNKTIRLVLNDAACMLIIYVLFHERKYLQLSFYVFIIELFVVLPLYFILKLSLEGPTEISSPFLSQIHRLIVNPMLMILLILGFVYQRAKSKV